MGASYGKLTPAHREAIYTLKKGGATGRVIREKLLVGHRPDGEDGAALAAVDVSASECNRIARRLLDERDELYSSQIKTMPAPEGLRVLTRRLMIVAERETDRLERAEKAGRLDANKLGKLATALTRLHGLLERNDDLPDPGEPANNGDSSPGDPVPSTFADELVSGDDGDTAPDAPTGPPAAVADQVLTPSGAPLGRPPASREAVPSDLPPQTSAAGTGGEVATSAGLDAGAGGASRRTDHGAGGGVAGVDIEHTI